MIKLNTKSVSSVIAGLVVALTLVIASSASAAEFLVNLTLGSTGSDVTALQNFLISNGNVIPAGPTGYFGAQTQSALAAYQSAKGIVPASGYFGPLTRASVNASTVVVVGQYPAGCTSALGFSTITGASCAGSTVSGCAAGALFSATTGASCTGATTPSTGLSGTDGTISAINAISQYSNEEVGEGQEEVKVAGFEIETSNDGDISIRSVKVTFDAAGSSGSTRLNKYVDTVRVWAGSEEVGSADAEDFNKDSTGVYSKTITLSKPVVKSDSTEKFYITLDTPSTLDTGDISGDSWTVDLINVRYEDGSGVVTTEDASLTAVAISFVSYSTAANTELKITKDSSSPTEGIVMVDETDNTDDVVLMKGKMKLEGTSDVMINELPITFTTTADSLADITGSVKLIIDGEEYTESVSTTTATTDTVVFDNLDLSVNAGDTISFTVLADINDVNDTGFVVGDTLLASLTTTNRDNMDVENSEGDQLADSNEKSGAVTGLAQAFYTDGIAASLVSTKVTTVASAVADATSSDVKTFEITFNVKAIGEDVYVDNSVVASSTPVTAGAGTAWATTTDSTANATNAGVATVSASGSTVDDTTNKYKINAGETRTFTVAVTLTATANGYTAVGLKGINWTLTAADGTAAENFYTFNLSDFKTSKVYMTKTTI